MILIYITNPNEEEAKKIAHHLIETRLIACANIFPITSIYRWEGKVKDDSEFVLIAKTRSELYDKVREEVESIHSYDTPCIIRIDADVNPAYARWIDGEVDR
ncbi:divalent-cation tolerance protein CutA [Candidatus Woesearchaeota archaeon]|nr:divalent-cation tolerance protein CutA [Candidatus Woesearchaeota archaeon]